GLPGLPSPPPSGAATESVPIPVRAKAGAPWAPWVGVFAATEGTVLAAVMVKVRASEAPPPGAGLSTVMGAEPAVVRSLAGMLAVSWVALTKVVARGLPFHCTTDAAMKLVPVTVRVKPGPPWKALLGASAVSAGTGLTAVMVKVRAFETPPPGAGLSTVMGAEPAIGRALV